MLRIYHRASRNPKASGALGGPQLPSLCSVVVVAGSIHTVQAQQMYKVMMMNVLQGYQLQMESHKHSIKPIKLIRFIRHNDSTCPVVWLNKYLQLQGSDVGPLFVRASQPVMSEDPL